MKKIFIFLLCLFSLSLPCFSQECESLFNTAMEYYSKGDFNSAKVYFNRVKEQCGEYRGVSNKIKECQDNINSDNNSSITVGNSIISFNPQGGIETIKINSGATQWSWGKHPDWVKLSKSKGQLVIECKGNSSGVERDAIILLNFGEGVDKTIKKIKVTQDKSFLSVSAKSINFPENGGMTYNVQVNSNDDWNVYAQSDSWFVVSKTDEGVAVSCLDNPMTSSRIGSFIIETMNGQSAEVQVVQSMLTPILEVETTNIKAECDDSYLKLKINTNISNWNAKIVEGGSWCEVEKKNDQELLLIMSANVSGVSRSVVVRITALDISKDITVTQRSLGYMSLYEDYFSERGGVWRIAPVSVYLYGGGRWGLRVSGYMVRWRVVEADLLNLNISFAKSFLLSWEPMVRGYLPLQRDGLAWTPYLGIGGCVPIINTPLNGNYYSDHSKLLFEIGTEFNLKLRNNQTVSSRVFFRLDGTLSLGASFDLHKWK